MHPLHKAFLTSVCGLVLSLAIFIPQVTHAAASSTDRMLTGYAWSSNIGWVSFNCDNEGTCLSDNEYKVKLLADGTLSGYAWSSNIGWIQFGGLSGFPSGSGTTAANSSVKSNAFTGWVKALSNGGGWDGWISLGGNTITSPVTSSNAPIPVDSSIPAAGAQGIYSVPVNANNVSGYAWGSDVVGWLSFSGPTYGVHIIANDPTTDQGYTGSSTNCLGPDGHVILDGAAQTYYQSSSVNAPDTCSSESRVCHDGVLGGDSSYQYPMCSVVPVSTDSLDAPKVVLSIAQNGGTFSHGPLVANRGAAISIKWDTTGGGTPDTCVGSAGLSALNPVAIEQSTPISLGALTGSGTYTITCTNAKGSSSDTVRSLIFNVNEF